jgi:Phage integrase, N-terminal SAM-like domain/Arm DNA-binding domain
MVRNRGHYWQVKVYAGRDPLTGQERREYGRASTKREAERLEAQLKAKVAEGRHRASAARTVADLLERWLEWRQGVKEISPTTLEDYRLQINRRIVPALGNLRTARQLGPHRPGTPAPPAVPRSARTGGCWPPCTARRSCGTSPRTSSSAQPSQPGPRSRPPWGSYPEEASLRRPPRVVRCWSERWILSPGRRAPAGSRAAP